MKEYTFIEDDMESTICYVVAENHDEAVAKAQFRNMPVDYSTDFYSETIVED